MTIRYRPLMLAATVSLLVSVSPVLVGPVGAAAPKAGAACASAKAYTVRTIGNTKLQCLPSGSRFVWKRVTKPKVKPTASNPIAPSALTKVIEHRDGTCTAWAPKDWELVAGAQNASADLVSADRSLVASWGLIIVPALSAPPWGAMPPYNDPAVYSNDARVALQAFLRYYESDNPKRDLAYTNDPAVDFSPYTQVAMRSSKSTLIALYARFPGDGYSSKYVLAVRLAKTPNDVWAKKGGLVANLALSISCTTTLNPSAGSPPKVSGSAGSAGAADEGNDSGYNPWLGTEYVHDPVTGTNYTVSQSQWSSDGPQGAGYYSGGTKMQPGRSD